MHRWRPDPVDPPSIHPHLHALPWPQRIAEVLRFSIASLEFNVSPGGGLRAWLRFNVAIGLFLAIPVLFVVPMVTALLTGMASWTALLLQIALNLLYTALAIAATVLLVRLFIRRR